MSRSRSFRTLVLCAIIALTYLPLPAAAAPTCAELQARLIRMDTERGIARRNGDLADAAKLSAIIAGILAQKIAQGCAP